jgi:hypothetical protein
MRLRRFTKDPDEKKRYGIDYTKWLDSSETVVSIALSKTGPDNTFIVDSGAVSPTGKRIIFFARGGTTGKQYNAYVTVTTSLGQIREDIIPFVVQSQ